ncbi:hypothetical protein BDV96DRAFT_639349 [Lophiotrema nucula]|uniref:Transmembrane protein n=1 Tax=Lophiotrema nucula TaxID=690887 RepID=A0A6A5ZWW7_9PLEO|nr:hypothetical protein BDV96DRAFT_639349 [Lophiotrema nucula]
MLPSRMFLRTFRAAGARVPAYVQRIPRTIPRDMLSTSTPRLFSTTYARRYDDSYSNSSSSSGSHVLDTSSSFSESTSPSSTWSSSTLEPTFVNQLLHDGLLESSSTSSASKSASKSASNSGNQHGGGCTPHRCSYEADKAAFKARTEAQIAAAQAKREAAEAATEYKRVAAVKTGLVRFIEDHHGVTAGTQLEWLLKYSQDRKILQKLLDALQHNANQPADNPESIQIKDKLKDFLDRYFEFNTAVGNSFLGALGRPNDPTALLKLHERLVRGVELKTQAEWFLFGYVTLFGVIFAICFCTVMTCELASRSGLLSEVGKTPLPTQSSSEQEKEEKADEMPATPECTSAAPSQTQEHTTTTKTVGVSTQEMVSCLGFISLCVVFLDLLFTF